MTESSTTLSPAAPGLDPGSTLSAPWSLDLGLPDFAAVRHQDIEPAVRAGMAQQRAQWEAVATDPAEPSIANTLVPLELSGELLDRALTVLYSLTAATDCPDLDELEERLAPDLAAHKDAFDLDVRLYRRYRSLHDRVLRAQAQGGAPTDPDGARIDTATARLVRLAVEDFERNGVALQGQDAARLRELNARLTTLTTSIGTRMAKAMHEAGVVNFTLTPALATTEPHSARLALLERSMGRGLPGRHDVRADVLEVVALRAERAQLLGYPHHAATVAAASAAKSSEEVSSMLTRLVGPAMANARQEAARYAGRMAADPATLPGEAFGPADWRRYEEAERKERFGVDDAALAPYLELWHVVEKGVFYAATALYGITFHERPDLAVHMYDPSVRVWEVRDQQAASPGQEAPVLALYVADLYYRPGKSGGAWMDELVTQSHLTGRRPVVINCASFEQPEDGPTLLSWDQVVTCFHEFGHALHGMFSDTYWPSAAGTSVPQDVVEFPSQVNESWALHPQVLASYAVHVDTGEALPAELVQQLRAQGSFGQGYATTEYLGAAVLDQAWHTLRPAQVPDGADQLEDFEHRALQSAGIDDVLVPPRYRTTYFQHVFAGGYGAAYYSYIWSEVMDADATDWFRTDGQGGQDGDLGLNRQAGERFRREFLCRGDSRSPLESFQALTGRRPRIEPLLRRRALG